MGCTAIQRWPRALSSATKASSIFWPCSAVISYARNESGTAQFDLVRFVSSARYSPKPLSPASAAKDRVTVECAVPDFWSAGQRKLQQILLSFIERCQFTDSGGITIRSVLPRMVRFVIADTGGKVLKRESVFEPFVRSPMLARPARGMTRTPIVVIRRRLVGTRSGQASGADRVLCPFREARRAVLKSFSLRPRTYGRISY